MTWVVKISGARGPMLVDYECPTHGRFEALVQRDDKGDPPEALLCPEIDEDGNFPYEEGIPCEEMAEIRICPPLARVNPIEAVKGKWQKPERPTWTDTRNLGEGQALYDWKEDRAKVWEEKRKQDVVDFAREHNERVIGGD